jgi:hypothetical protein
MGAERERRGVPTTVGGRAVRRQPVIGPEVVEQAVDVDIAQVGQRPALVVQQAAGGQAHLPEIERVRRYADVRPDGRHDRGDGGMVPDERGATRRSDCGGAGGLDQSTAAQ